MIEVYVNHCYSKSVFFIYLITYGLIHRKLVSGEMTTIILNDQWISFKLEYELVNIEINKSKVDELVENELRRREISFI